MKVQRCEQHKIGKKHPLFSIVDKYCLYSKNVYNEANYLVRQEFINHGEILHANEIQKLMQNMDCYKECGSQSAQKTIQLLDHSWKSFFKASKDYSKHPERYLLRYRDIFQKTEDKYLC